ncbi:hypothetical protein Tco_0453488 [Tanacetum coccineum]
MVSAIVSATSYSEFSSKSENRSKGDLDSSRLSVLKSFLDDRNSLSGSLKGVNSSFTIDTPYPTDRIRRIGLLNEYVVLGKKVRYVVSNGSGYARIRLAIGSSVGKKVGTTNPESGDVGLEVCAAGYKDTTATELQLLEDLQLSNG